MDATSQMQFYRIILMPQLYGGIPFLRKRDRSHFVIMPKCSATPPLCGAMGIVDLFARGNTSKHCTTMTTHTIPSPL